MTDWSSHTALVVEDSMVQRAHLVHLLRTSGFGTVLEAGDGLDALCVLERHGMAAVSLILTDLDMPKMDGIELIRKLSEGQFAQDVIVTSGRDPRLLEIVERMACEDARLRLLGTLAKPVQLSDLSDMLENLGKGAHLPSAAGAAGTVFDADEIDSAIREQQFVPFFQPKISMKTGLIQGVEALARWNHPREGILAPLDFMPLIEGTPMIEPFTLSIAGQALQHLTEWRRRGLTALSLSINLSAHKLDERAFIERLADMADAHAIPPKRITWEVTETMLMNHVSESLANLARLGLKGFGLSMDDYGIGYSSLQQFARCPFTELKIDRAFIKGATRRPNRRVVLESAIEMGRRLGVATVAEGVECQADWDLLQALGCDFAQGYLVARPMPASELPQWIRENSARLKALALAGGCDA